MGPTLYVISGIMLFVLASGMIGTAFAADSPDVSAPTSAYKPAAIEEFSGEVAELTGTQTADIVWDKDNFGGFCYDINSSFGTETLAIAAGTLTGPNVDRTIEEDRLVYTTTPISQTYAIIDDGVANSLGRVDGRDVTNFAVEGWMGKKCIAISTGGSTATNANKLSKLLVEFKTYSDKKTLATEDPWDLGGGFTLTAKQIDLQGDKVWLSLGKDSKEIDSAVIDAGPYGGKRYIHTEDLCGVEDVVFFFCWVDAVFRGTESNLVQVKYVFLIDDAVEKIETSTTYGKMEVKIASADRVVLENDGSIDLIRNTHVEIMGDLSFKTANNAGAIEVYPHLVRDELPVLTKGDEFAAWDSGESIWNSTYKPTATEELSGEPAELAGTQTTNLVWNKNNFEGFWYDIDGGVGTETLSIATGTLTGPNTDRIIEVGTLSYTTSPFWQEYELHKNLGLTVARNSHTSDPGYWTEFWRGERYVAINGNSNKLAKPLIEFNDADIKTLATEEAWDLGGGLALVAKQIDLMGEKVWLCLHKDGTELDSVIIDTGSSDLQNRVYSYTADIAGESDVPVFSCYVSGVFRGVESNLIQVKYAFLIDNVIYQISAGDTYDNMEVVSTTPSQVTLENRNNIALSQAPSTHQIMGNLSFKTVDNSGAIEFYPHLIRNELVVLSGGGDGFGSVYCGIYSWNLYENYTIGWYQVDLRGEKAWIALCKDGVTVDTRIMTEEFKTQVDSECRYSYAENGIEVINATLKEVFRGCTANMIELGEVYQYSEVDGRILLNNESHILPAATEPSGTPWNLSDGYVFTVPDIGLDGEDIRLQLSKDGVVVKEKILNEDYANTFTYTSGSGSLDCVVDGVFRGCLVDVVKLRNVNQYSSTGTQLMDDESKTYATADPVGRIWECWEGYSLAPKDIDMEGNKVWLSLLKDGVSVKDVIVDSRGHDISDATNWFKYYNATGALVFSTYIDAVFRGTESNLVQVRYTSQYSEVDGRLFIAPDAESWHLQEGYYLTAQETYSNNSVWLQLSKNDKLVDEGLFYNSFDLQNDATGHTIVSGTISDDSGYDYVQLTSVTQYSEAIGTVLATYPSATLYTSWSFKYDRKTLATPSRLARTFAVDDSGGADFTSIHAAVDAAIYGDTIYVHAGEYVENVCVDKRLTLQGEGVDVVTVRAPDASGSVFQVAADCVSISGFTVTGAVYGIYLIDADHCNISGNDISNNSGGIYSDHSSNNILTGNTITINQIDGYAIQLHSSGGNTLENNIVESGCLGILVIGHTKEDYNNSIDTSNMLNGKPIHYYYDLHGATIQGLDTTHLTVACSDNVTIRNNDIRDGDIVFLPFLSDSTITSNTVRDNYYGIYLWGASGNNTLYHNNLINNTMDNASDEGYTNQWDDGSEGNYYSDYTGTDSGGDGIGDDFYHISGSAGSVDRYPLMQPLAPQKGDLDGDDRITSADAAIALRLAAIGTYDDTADVSGDGRVTSLDALTILQAAAENIEL